MTRWVLNGWYRTMLVSILAGTGTVQAATCMLSVGSLNFGLYTGAQATSSTNMTMTCTKAPLLSSEQVDFIVSLSPGGSASYAQRLMARTILPADSLPYNLYIGSVPGVLNTQVWGDGTGGTVRWSGRMVVNNGNPTRFESTTLAGAVPGGAFPSAGTYQDTVTATFVIS
jgi:spore coat protein U-like protein